MGKSESRAKRRASRVNKRLERDVPLLLHAGVVAPITTSEAKQQLAAHDAAIAEHFEKLGEKAKQTEQHAQQMRAVVAGLVSAGELARLDEQRGHCPPSPEYAADHWGQQLRRLAPELASQHGYPPVPISMPVNRQGGHSVLRRGGQQAEALRAFLDQLDQKRMQAAGGEQLPLLSTHDEEDCHG